MSLVMAKAALTHLAAHVFLQAYRDEISQSSSCIYAEDFTSIKWPHSPCNGKTSTDLQVTNAKALHQVTSILGEDILIPTTERKVNRAHVPGIYSLPHL
jgi:hypothetical protein